MRSLFLGLFMAFLASAAPAQDNTCYPGLGNCGRINTGLDCGLRINLGKPGCGGGGGGDQTQSSFDRAVAFVDNLHAIWSEPNARALPQVEGLYDRAGSVQYYGKWRSYSDVISDKYSFASKWPSRTMRFTLDTVNSRCSSDTECRIRGQRYFDSRNPNTGRRAEGYAYMDYTISFRGGTPYITSESSR